MYRCHCIERATKTRHRTCTKPYASLKPGWRSLESREPRGNSTVPCVSPRTDRYCSCSCYCCCARVTTSGRVRGRSVSTTATSHDSSVDSTSHGRELDVARIPRTPFPCRARGWRDEPSSQSVPKVSPRFPGRDGLAHSTTRSARTIHDVRRRGAGSNTGRIPNTRRSLARSRAREIC